LISQEPDLYLLNRIGVPSFGAESKEMTVEREKSKNTRIPGGPEILKLNRLQKARFWDRL